MTNGTVFSGWLKKPFPGLLELFDDSEVEYDEILSGDDQLFFTE